MEREGGMIIDAISVAEDAGGLGLTWVPELEAENSSVNLLPGYQRVLGQAHFAFEEFY